jgi:hypothetical protein
VTADDEHATLASVWDGVRRILEGMPTSLRFVDVHYVEVSDKAQRVKSLGVHLEGAVSLMRSERYESAFALLRTCLEHVIVDWLVFQGRTFVKRFSSVSEETWQQWQDARADGAEWTRTIQDWHRTKKGHVRIVHEGIFSEPDEDGRRQQLSIYYFLLEQYRPTVGPPGRQVDDGLIGRDELRQMAMENHAIWEVYLTWSSLLTNLRENQLVDAEDAGRLAVHYRFLSGYAHPVADQRRETYGRDTGLGWPRFDHYSSELILLYAITLGTHEIRNFLASLRERPDVAITDLDGLGRALGAAEDAASHFWFLGLNPHAYDVWKTRNEIAFRAFRAENALVVPPEPAPEDVAYPPDPLRRLIAMHSSTQEMTTGLAYISPWERRDARLR